MTEEKFTTDRKNTFTANDWFDINFLAKFLHSDLKVIEQINQQTYDNAVPYNLGTYIDLPQNGQSEYLNFGDEYYFYGNFETDITATIYEMKYLVNLGRNQFTNTSNPTWMSGTTSYLTEIGLYNDQKDLMVISKLQSPELRQGIQQFVVKLDF